MSELVLQEVVGKGIVILTLNRPERRNALSIELLTELCERVEGLAADGESRVLILRGAGPVFSAGLDLKEASNPELADRSGKCVERVLGLLRSTSLVTIAAASGGAYAGGAGLVAACDMAVGSDDLQMAFPEVRRGLLPALICAVLRPKVRDGDLRELFLVANTIGAARAHQIGILQRVVPTEQVLEVAKELAEGIVLGGPNAVRWTKELLNRTIPGEVDPHSPMLAKLHLDARQSAEAKEGFAAFLEKRAPNWVK